MKGIIFNLLEDYITTQKDEDAWEQILALCSLENQAPLDIVGPGTYSDNDFMEIISQSASFMNLTPADLLHQLGRYALPVIASRYPSFFTPLNHPRDFLKFTGMIHETEIKKLYKDAETPQFGYREIDANHITVKYTSKRFLPTMVEGLLEGLSEFYNIPMQITVQHNSKKPSCEFDIKF